MPTDYFDQMAEAIENATSLDRLEARGTLRLALKQAGLEAGSVTGGQMAVVMRKVMPKELETRGIDGAASICDSLARQAEANAPSGDGFGDSPEAVFQRLGG